MTDGLLLSLFKYGGVALVVVGLSWCVYASFSTETVFSRYYRQYVNHIDRRLAQLFLPASSHLIVTTQAALMLALLGISIWTRLSLGYALALAVAIAPVGYLYRARLMHVRRLEAQVDSLITGLANALRTVPSPAAAMNQVASVLAAPMRLEVQRLLKEMRLGSTLEQSLLSMSSRLKSQDLDSALSALLIGLQVGGNLPEVLETTGSTIREMNRLEGVIKTKTAEGRAQLWVLALLPCALCFAFRFVDPDYFAPMTTTLVGKVVAAVAGLLWLAALPIAHKILKVDI
ncbi:MAG TPA: type II secretion system F family protein [Polyangiaceae bacterium]|nr:type II secretion system F family protein [Polyangiaceae bacterium]